MKFDIKSRERAFRDMLVDMKGRLDAENDFLEISFMKDEHWKGEEFKYVFSIKKPYVSNPFYMSHYKLTSEQYDKYIELKDFASSMFEYLVNHDAINCMKSEDETGVEFEFISVVHLKGGL